jgi:hypothetical protein
MPNAAQNDWVLTPPRRPGAFRCQPLPALLSLQPPENIHQILLPNFADYFRDFFILVYSHGRVTTGRRFDGDSGLGSRHPSRRPFLGISFLNELRLKRRGK